MDANMNRPTLSSVYIGRRTEPAKGKGGRPWEHYAWRLTLAKDGRSMDFDYRAGLAHCGKLLAKPWGAPKDARFVYNAFGPGRGGWETPKAPTLFDALSCQCMDARSYDDARDFEEWASDLGFDADSREAERVYRLCADGARDLRRVLGHAMYAELTAMGEDALRAWCEASPSPEAAR